MTQKMRKRKFFLVTSTLLGYVHGISVQPVVVVMGPVACVSSLCRRRVVPGKRDLPTAALIGSGVTSVNNGRCASPELVPERIEHCAEIVLKFVAVSFLRTMYCTCITRPYKCQVIFPHK